MNRTHTPSGRFQRLGMFSARPAREGLQTQILSFIEDTPRILLLLRAMKKTDGDRRLQTLVGPAFDRYMGIDNGIYRIGEEEVLDGKFNCNGIGQAILPRAKPVLGKEHPIPVILIPMLAMRNRRTDTFILTISRIGELLEADVAIGWREDRTCSEWPERRTDMLLLRDKVKEVVRIIFRLDPVRAACAA